MGDFVLKLINAPINDLSGFASEQGFIFFFIIIVFYIIAVLGFLWQPNVRFLYIHIYICERC